jgi:integration host factor subunit beta
MRLTPHGLLGTLEIKEWYKMLKSELVHRVADKHTQHYQRDIEKIFNAILDEITSAMSRGDRVELRGFGTFAIKIRPARVGRNPRTGAVVPVHQKAALAFKASKVMRERLNPGHTSGT